MGPHARCSRAFFAVQREKDTKRCRRFCSSTVKNTNRLLPSSPVAHNKISLGAFCHFLGFLRNFARTRLRSLDSCLQRSSETKHNRKHNSTTIVERFAVLQPFQLALGPSWLAKHRNAKTKKTHTHPGQLRSPGDRIVRIRINTSGVTRGTNVRTRHVPEREGRTGGVARRNKSQSS